MGTFFLNHEPAIRLGAFCGTFLVMATWEWRAPCRRLVVSKTLRWTNNLAVVLLSTAFVRVVLPVTAAGAATWAEHHQWGLAHWLGLPGPLAVALSMVVLDWVIWFQHRMVHAVPVLWRLHRVHHADLDYDVTTGARFHPLEILLSTLIKCAAVVTLGAPAVAVVMFEVVLNATAMFNHGNVQLPAALDRALRRVVVTPDMHRVHHSVAADESNSNFGFNLPWWDHLFGTYRAAPRGGHRGMVLGIADHRSFREVNRLPGMLALPFRDRGDTRPQQTAGTTLGEACP